jgi:prepilin-type N-terminal cleavage/methylation domain-containing protein
MKTSHTCPCSYERGFTMVEVLVVLAIVGILAATTIPPYLKQRPQRMLSATTNLLVANINDARVMAVRENQRVYMEFLPEVDTFRLWDESNWSRYIAGVGSGFSIAPVSVTAFSISPVRTYSPMLNLRIYSGVPYVSRNYGSDRAIASDRVIPNEVDFRMDPNPCADQNPNSTALTARPLSLGVPDRYRLLSRAPLLFLTFYPDGSISNSWVYGCSSVNEYREPIVGRHLGATELFLQVRGNENAFTSNNYVSDYNMIDIGLFPNQSLSTMYYEDGTPRYVGVGSKESEVKFDSTAEANGKRIVINNATGRVMVESWAPYNIDIPPIDIDGNGQLDDFEVLREDDNSFANRKHWM